MRSFCGTYCQRPPKSLSSAQAASNSKVLAAGEHFVWCCHSNSPKHLLVQNLLSEGNNWANFPWSREYYPSEGYFSWKSLSLSLKMACFSREMKSLRKGILQCGPQGKIMTFACEGKLWLSLARGNWPRKPFFEDPLTSYRIGKTRNSKIAPNIQKRDSPKYPFKYPPWILKKYEIRIFPAFSGYFFNLLGGIWMSGWYFWPISGFRGFSPL